jgi:hypothetical protein
MNCSAAAAMLLTHFSPNSGFNRSVQRFVQHLGGGSEILSFPCTRVSFFGDVIQLTLRVCCQSGTRAVPQARGE